MQELSGQRALVTGVPVIILSGGSQGPANQLPI